MLFFSIIIGAFSYHTVASRVNLVLSDVNQLSEKITLTPNWCTYRTVQSGLYALADKPIFWYWLL
jgi:hypothetical protein